jgi:hypothetical protein
MTEPRFSRPITVTQVVGLVALVLIVLFVGAFASKAVESYRLGMWLHDIEQEIAAMERQREVLQLELERRQSKAWIDQALKEAGRIPPDVLAVRLATSEADDTSTGLPAAPTPRPAFRTPTLAAPEKGRAGPLFGNPNWKAWMDLILSRQ